MAIVKKQPRKRTIDISGPAGNAFALMGVAQDFARQLGMEKEDITALIDDVR